jgi:hypothetical protein
LLGLIQKAELFCGPENEVERSMSYRKLTEGKRFLPLAVPPVSRQVVFVVALVIDVTVAAVGEGLQRPDDP